MSKLRITSEKLRTTLNISQAGFTAARENLEKVEYLKSSQKNSCKIENDCKIQKKVRV